jgi:hypothetical protein
VRRADYLRGVVDVDRRHKGPIGPVHEIAQFRLIRLKSDWDYFPEDLRFGPTLAAFSANDCDPLFGSHATSNRT